MSHWQVFGGRNEVGVGGMEVGGGVVGTRVAVGGGGGKVGWGGEDEKPEVKEGIW